MSEAVRSLTVKLAMAHRGDAEELLRELDLEIDAWRSHTGPLGYKPYGRVFAKLDAERAKLQARVKELEDALAVLREEGKAP